MSELNTEKLFEFAVRHKMRFPYKGAISVEDLFDLSVQNLDAIFKTLNGQKQKACEESLLATKTKEDEYLDVQIALVKYVFNLKVEEANERLRDRERRKQEQKIMSIIAAKDEEELQSKSKEELLKMLDDLK